jgi:hypothetical protein
VTDVELVVRNELDRMIPRTRSAPNWSDVVRRVALPAPRRRPMLSRPLVLAVAFAAAAILSAVGYAVVRYVIVGSPAPQAVKDRLTLLDTVKGELIPKVHRRSGIEVAKTRAAAVLQASTGPVYLWVAPTEQGGYCRFVQIVGTETRDGGPNLGGGCVSPKQKVDIGTSGSRVHDKWLELVVGHAAAPARRVRVRFASGAQRSFTLSPRGFLLAEVRANDSIREITVLSGTGRLISRQRGLPASGPHALPFPTPTGPGHTVAVIRTVRTHRPIVLRIAPGAHGTRCTILITPGGTGRSCGGRPPKPDEMGIYPEQIGSASSHGMLLYWGVVGSKIKTVELRFEDGTQVALSIHEGFVLYQVRPSNFGRGRRPIELIGRDASRRSIATKRLGPYAP